MPSASPFEVADEAATATATAPSALRPDRVPRVLVIRRRYLDPRTAGQTMMLIGLLYLIVYDVCFVAGYVSPVAASLLLLLLPAAYLMVLLMRWWSKILSLSQKPTFQRAR